MPTSEPSISWLQALDIMGTLGETAHQPRVQISRAIELLGLDVVHAVVIEAQTTESNGGLLRQDGQRRTLGGVFFSLLRGHCTAEQRKHIFWIDKPKPKKPQPVPVPPPSEQALGIAATIIQKLKLSPKKQAAIAREVDRVGVAEALTALRVTMKAEANGGRMDAEGKRLKPLQAFVAALG